LFTMSAPAPSKGASPAASKKAAAPKSPAAKKVASPKAPKAASPKAAAPKAAAPKPAAPKPAAPKPAPSKDAAPAKGGVVKKFAKGGKGKIGKGKKELAEKKPPYWNKETREKARQDHKDKKVANVKKWKEERKKRRDKKARVEAALKPERKAYLERKKKRVAEFNAKLKFLRLGHHVIKSLPETNRKRIVRAKARREVRIKRRIEKIKKIAEVKKDYFVRAEKYVKEYKDKAKQLLRAQLKARKKGDFFVPPQPKLAVVTRIRGILGVSPKPRKALQLLRLRQINNTVFVRLNKATLNMLRIVEPYVAWGYPTLSTIKKLIYKKGFLKHNAKRVPLLSNRQIAKVLGKYNIICVEDLIHEIYTTGPQFARVNRFLWPFKLSNPRGGFKDKGTHFVEGGDAGNRENFINDLLNRMI